MKVCTREERQRLIDYIDREVRKGTRAADIKKELKLSNSYYADLRSEVHIYARCKICGNEFEKKRMNNKYCSAECAMQYQREYNIKKCRAYKEAGSNGKCNTSERAKEKDRPFTRLSCQSIVIDDFEGISIETIATMYGRTEKSIKDKLNELQASGMYDRIIRTWKLQAPHLYKRALKKRKKVTA